MSNPTDAGEMYENVQQREEEVLAVITESSEASPQNGSDPHVEGSADNQSKENEHHDDQEQQQPQPHDSEEGSAETEDKLKESGDKEDGDKPKLTEDKQEGDTLTDKVITVGPSTILVENQEVVTSSTGQRQQRKHSTGRARSTARRSSYQTSRSYAGGSFQNYGLTYLPYKSNFEPSEDARRKADEFFKTQL